MIFLNRAQRPLRNFSSALVQCTLPARLSSRSRCPQLFFRPRSNALRKGFLVALCWVEQTFHQGNLRLVNVLYLCYKVHVQTRWCRAPSTGGIDRPSMWSFQSIVVQCCFDQVWEGGVIVQTSMLCHNMSWPNLTCSPNTSIGFPQAQTSQAQRDEELLRCVLDFFWSDLFQSFCQCFIGSVKAIIFQTLWGYPRSWQL